MGCVKAAPAPVLEIVSGADATTEVSVVGKPPMVGLGVAAAPGDALGTADDATTDVSSVGKLEAALPVGDGELSAAAIGDGSGFCGSPDSPVMFAFCNAAC